jgi:hypothetical protein
MDGVVVSFSGEESYHSIASHCGEAAAGTGTGTSRVWLAPQRREVEKDRPTFDARKGCVVSLIDLTATHDKEHAKPLPEKVQSPRRKSKKKPRTSTRSQNIPDCDLTLPCALGSRDETERESPPLRNERSSPSDLLKTAAAVHFGTAKENATCKGVTDEEARIIDEVVRPTANDDLTVSSELDHWMHEALDRAQYRSSSSLLEARSTLSSPGTNPTLREKLRRVSRSPRHHGSLTPDATASSRPPPVVEADSSVVDLQILEAIANPPPPPPLPTSRPPLRPSISATSGRTLAGEDSMVENEEADGCDTVCHRRVRGILSHDELDHVTRLRQERKNLYDSMGAVSTSQRSLNKSRRRTHRIKLHIYDLIASDALMLLPWGFVCEIGKCFNEMNESLYKVGTGAYHGKP